MALAYCRTMRRVQDKEAAILMTLKELTASQGEMNGLVTELTIAVHKQSTQIRLLTLEVALLRKRVSDLESVQSGTNNQLQH